MTKLELYSDVREKLKVENTRKGKVHDQGAQFLGNDHGTGGEQGL